MDWVSEGRVIERAVNEMRAAGVGVTATRVEQVVAVVNAEAGDALQRRSVVHVGLAPRRPDGSGGEVVKTIRTGPPVQATFAGVTPYFRLSAEKKAEYEAQAAGLKAQLATPGIDPAIKTRLQQDLAKVEHLLGMDRSPTPDLRPMEELRTQA